MKGPHKNCWFDDSVTDIHICNNYLLMTKYWERPIKICGSTLNKISPRKGKIQLRLGLKNGSKELILNLKNIYYLSKSSCNLLSLGLLNNSNIYHNNENEIFYKFNTRQILAHAQCWRNGYLLKLLNLTNKAVNILKVDDNTYQWPTNILYIMANSFYFITLTTWHKRLDHTYFTSLNTFLRHLKVSLIDDSKNNICDSCNRAKAIKIYNYEPQKCT